MILIDGNNVIGGRVGWHRDKPAARKRLLEELACLAKVKRTRLSVVFDGAPDPAFPDGSSYRGIKIYYARSGSDADARIIEMAETEINKKNLTIVTSDRALAGRVRVCGVRVMRSGEFRGHLDAAVRPLMGQNPDNGTDAEISNWLRYFGVDQEESEPDDDEGNLPFDSP
jgi:predicted RNA-binding protein with PIN domain